MSRHTAANLSGVKVRSVYLRFKGCSTRTLEHSGGVVNT